MVRKKCSLICCNSKRLPFGLAEDSEGCKALKNAMAKTVTDLIEQQGVTHFITNMCRGAAIYGAEILLERRAVYPDIVLECIIPYENQAARWPEAQRERYFSIISQCDVETLFQRRYSGDCFQKCRQYLIEQADYVIVVRGNAPDGLEKVAEYARSQGKRAVVL